MSRSDVTQALLDKIQTGNRSDIKHLLTIGTADLSSLDGTSKNNLLHLIAQNGRIQFAERVLAESRNKDKAINMVNAAGDTPLLAAIKMIEDANNRLKDGYIKLVKTLVINGADINAADAHGQTALHVAVIFENFTLVKYLLAHGADINAADAYGETPLHIAVTNQNEKLIKYLTSHEADSYAIDTDGNSPVLLALKGGTLPKLVLDDTEDEVNTVLIHNSILHRAAEKGDVKLIGALLDQGAQVDAADRDGKTALTWAVLNNKVEAVKLLLANGADIKLAAGDSTILNLASSLGHLELVRYLVEEKGLSVNKGDSKGIMPLHCAAREGYEEVIEYLLYREALINFSDKDGKTALHFAIANNKPAIVESLLQHQANLYIADKDHQTPLDLAIAGKRDELLKLVVNWQDEHGNTALHLAVRDEKYDVIQLLLNSGAQVDISNHYGNSPLHVASINGYQDAVKLLVTAGADIFAKDNNGNAAIELALINQKFELVKYMLALNEEDLNSVQDALFLVSASGSAKLASYLMQEFSAEPLVVSDNGQTPLDVAVQNDHLEVVNAILGVKNINEQDKEGNTALHHAILEGNETLAKYLIKKGARLDLLNEDGENALHLTAKQDAQNLLQMLLACGIDPNIGNREGNTALHILVFQHNWMLATSLLDNNININAQNASGKTALHIAIEQNNTFFAKLLLSRGADIKIEDQNGATPLKTAMLHNMGELIKVILTDNKTIPGSYNQISLHLACERGDFTIVKYLVQHSPKALSSIDDDGQTPLHIASKRGQIEIATYLLQHHKSLINKHDNQGLSPLHSAVIAGEKEMVEFLLDSGAKIDATAEGHDSQTALMMAIINGHTEIVKSLLIRGADSDLEDKNGHTAPDFAVRHNQLDILKLIEEKAPHSINILQSLLWAVQEGSRSVIPYLLEKGADIFAVDREIGLCALELAINNCSDVISLLLQGGVDGISNVRTGNTYLHTASAKGQINIVQYLIANGANINAQNIAKITPLSLACTNNNISVVNYLLMNGADADCLDRSNTAPLHLACMLGYNNIIQALVQNGASMDLCDYRGNTPLFYAVHNADYIAANILLQNKAQVDLTGNSYTALHIACSRGNIELAKLFIQYGANVNALNNERQTALHLAVGNNHLAIAKLVIAKGANPYMPDSNWATPIDIARENKQYELLDVLLGIDDKDVNLIASKNNTALYNAVLNEDIDIIKYLIEVRGADVNAGNPLENTALHAAVMKGNIEIVKYLLEHRALVTITNILGQRPIDIAIINDSFEVVKLLLGISETIDDRGAYGNTPLHNAVLTQDIALVNYLCAHGANRQVVNEMEQTPLDLAGNNPIIISVLTASIPNTSSVSVVAPSIHKAVENNQPYLVSKLLTNSDNLNAKDEHGKTPLYIAVETNNETLAQLLLEAGAKVDAVLLNNETPLHAACAKGNLNMVTLLLQYSAPLNILSGSNFTPVDKAIYSGKTNIVKYLVEEKWVEANSHNKYGVSFLHIACAIGNIEMLEYLLEQQTININISDKHGNTPLHLACRGGKAEAVYLLLKHHADYSMTNAAGKTPLEIARELEYSQITGTIIEHISHDNFAPSVVDMMPYELESLGDGGQVMGDFIAMT